MRFFKQLCCQQLLSASATGNSEVDLCEILATLTTTPNKAHMNSKPSEKQPTRVDISSVFPTDLTAACLEENGLYYVCGYLLRKLLKFHVCAECDLLLTELEPSGDSTTVYLLQRSFTKSFRGGLVTASACFVDYVKQCEQIFMNMFDAIGHQPKILNVIVKEMLQVPSPVSCTGFPKNRFLHLFVRMRIYYTLKFHNRNIKQKKPPAKKHRKLCKIQHQ